MKEVRWPVGIGLAVSTSLLLLLSFPTFNLNTFGFIALVPIFFLAYTSGLKRAFLYGILSGFLFYCLYLFWMNAYLAMVGVAFVTIVYGGYFVIALLFINLTSRALPRYRAFLTPFIWIAIEYVKSFGFLGLTFGSMGYTQHNFLRFIQIADIGGEPLVSFLIVLFNAGVAHLCALLYEKKQEKLFRTGTLSIYI
jgi:apolipoprotein N-acyltransferase